MKKFLSFLMAVFMVAGFLPVFSPAISAEDLTGGEPTVTADHSSKPADYVPPEQEEGKIHLNGYYTVANDGQLMANLEWTYPFTNPLTGVGVDPGRPYWYKMWQAKKNKDGTWTQWETRSPVDVDKADGQVRVLNVCPNSASMAYLKDWMNREVLDRDNTRTTIGRGIIKVTPVLLDTFNQPGQAEKLLKTDPDTGELTTEYQYSVIMFGTYDANSNKDLTADSRDATLAFARAGGGLMFGHDTLTGYTSVGVRPYFSRFAESDFMDLTLLNEATTHVSNYIKVVDTGFLTSRPWDLEGKTLNIPTTHMLGQKVPVSSSATVWMQFSDASGNVLGGITPTYAQQNNVTMDNFYLATNGATAMIQTGHTSGGATDDEAKVFANTLLYLSQSTVTTTARDSSFIDEAAPNRPDGAVTSVVPASDLTNYVATVELSGGADNGTDYSYRIQGIPQTSLEGDDDYKEMWSSTATDPEDDSVLQLTALSGLKGYYVKAVNNNPDAETADPATAKANLIPLTGDKTAYTTPALVPGGTYYVHVFAVDYAGNVSEDLVLPISVSGRKAIFHYNDGTGVEEQTLLTSIGTLATMPEKMTRDGYAFLGWFENADGSGEMISKDSVFSDAAYPDGVDLYAKWIEVYTVTIGQRGEGEVSLSSADGQVNPFRKGTDVLVSYQPASGYRVAGVWLDEQYLEPAANGTLTIPALDREYFVLVEFEPVDPDEPPVGDDGIFYRVDTALNGGAGSTITPSVCLAADDAKTENYTVRWQAAPGYRVKMVKVDGIVRSDLIGKTSVTFAKIAADHSVEVTFVTEEEFARKDTYWVQTKLTGGPGTISPSLEVAPGSDYSVQAAVGDSRNYEIASVKVYDAEGNPVTGVSTDAAAGKADLRNIMQDYLVEVQLQPKKQAGTVTVAEDDLLRVDTSIIGRGSITSSKIVKRGENAEVTWTVETGWHIREVLIDGERIYYPEKGTVTAAGNGSYSFEDIEKHHSVRVVLEKSEPEPEIGFFAVDTKITSVPGAVITSGNSMLPAGSDYTVEWSVGDRYVVGDVLINGVSHPDLVAAKSYQFSDLQEDSSVEVVVKRSFELLTVAAIPDQIYNGEGLEPTVEVRDGDRVLTEGIDYEVEYRNNVEIGEAEVVIKGKGNYAGTLNTTFEIVKRKLTIDSVNILDKYYDGNTEATVDLSTLKVSGLTEGDAAKLQEGLTFVSAAFPQSSVGTYPDASAVFALTEAFASHYYFETADGTKADRITVKDEASILIRGIDTPPSGGENPPGENPPGGEDPGDNPPVKTTITIDPIPDEIYSGKEIKPQPVVRDGDRVLTEGVDYEVEYRNNTEVGEAEVVIKGKGNYAGTLNTTFEILKRKLTIEDLKIEDKYYDGTKEAKATYRIEGLTEADEAKAKEQLTLEKAEFPKEDVGTYPDAFAVLKLNGSFAEHYYFELPDGTKTDSIRLTDEASILSKPLTPPAGTNPPGSTPPGENPPGGSDPENPGSQPQITVAPIPDYSWTGKEITPPLVVKDGDKVLVEGKDYTVEFKNNVEVGKADVVIVGKGNYSGKLDTEFQITGLNIDKDGDGKPDVNVDPDDDGKPDINVDTDGDKEPDINIDTDDDGKPDINIDTDDDGKPDINIDTDEDGKPDINIDTDGDGKPDINIDTDDDGKPDINIDTDDDGKPDINVDTDGDGKPDLNIDADGDGKPDYNVDINGDGIPDVNILGGSNDPPKKEFPNTFDGPGSALWLIVLSAVLFTATVLWRRRKTVCK